MDDELEKLVGALGNWSVGKEPLYRLLASSLRQAIKERYLPAGAKLPPERHLAQALAISRSTVVAAYRLLREEELVESRQGSGTVVRASRVSSNNLSYHSKLSRQLTQEIPGYRQPQMVDFATGTIGGLKELVKKETKFKAEELHRLLGEGGYSAAGLFSLRQALARWFTQTGLATQEDQILITTGTQQAISLLAQLFTRRGDYVLLDNPSFLGAIDVFKAFGTRLKGISFLDAEPGVAALENLVRSVPLRLFYLMPTFQNPTGYVLTANQRAHIAFLSTELQLPVIEDHTLSYFELTNQNPPPKPIACYGPEGHKIITIGSLSKLVWAGLRVGWVRGPASVIAELTRLKVINDLGSSILDQAITARLLTRLAEAQRLRQKQLLPRLRYLTRLLNQLLPEWQWQAPEGGLFLWVKLPEGSNAGEFAQLALRNGVMLMPGTNLAVEGGYLNFLRIPFFLEPAYLEEGVLRMVQVWRSYR
jgi:DNA-binding transcriptional MocR family regulator